LDSNTRKFVDACLSRAAEDIRSCAADGARASQAEREIAHIRLNGAAAIERLEMGQVTAALKFKGARYMG